MSRTWSWNVYNAANIARVKADEDAAAAREAAADQRMQDLDAERRAAILRGRTPPPLPEDEDRDSGTKRSREGGHDRKRRKLRGEDDTDADIRFAASMTKSRDSDDGDVKILKLRKPTSDAPLTDYAGNISLFPVDVKEASKREKNAEAEREKRKKEQAFEDQYTMRFANAAGKNGLDQPWYLARQKSTQNDQDGAEALEYPGFESKNVWGNEDPRRKEREEARITSNDPFAFMQKAQRQLQKSKEDRKKWELERNQDLRDLKSAQAREERSSKHRASSRGDGKERTHDSRHAEGRSSRSSHRHRSRSRSPGGERTHRSSHRRDRSRSRDRERDNRHSRHGRRRSPEHREHQGHKSLRDT